MDQDAITQYVADTFSGVDISRPTDGPGAGDTFFIYDPERNLEPKQQFPFATIVTKDYGDFDNTSQLDRPGVFRLNIGVSRDTFKVVADQSTNRDYAALDQLMPHPVYAAQSWLCVLNPSPQTFEQVKPLLAEAYDRAVRRIINR
jgi:Family of unknown function (DUF6194)